MIPEPNATVTKDYVISSHIFLSDATHPVKIGDRLHVAYAPNLGHPITVRKVHIRTGEKTGFYGTLPSHCLKLD